MTDHPILMNGEMVRAILDGRKTQTRRPVKVPGGVPEWAKTFEPVQYEPGKWLTESGPCSFVMHCPLGIPGDRLWVRETWGFSATLPYSTKDEMSWLAFRDLRGYRADQPEGNYCWRPSIHMPRWASRLTLEVSDVRVQRVQEITASDAEAEGCGVWSPPSVAIDVFRLRWNSLYAKRGLGWEANPWCWAITFRRLEG